MITVFDMATGETLACWRAPSADPDHNGSNGPCVTRLPQLSLQEVRVHRPAVQMPPDLAHLDIAEVLARFE